MMKIFATDLDGTLLKSENKIDESVKRGIKCLKDNGFKIIGVSGRVSSSIRHFMNELEIYDYIIGNNGSIILDKEDKIVYKNPLSMDNLKRIFDLSDKYGIKIRMYGKDTYYSEELKDNQISHMKVADDKYSVKFETRKDFKEYVLENKIDIFKILLNTNQKNYEKFYEEISRLDSVYITRSGEENLDISSKGVNKYTALSHLIEKVLRLEDAKLYTIGDFYNDIEMVENAHIGIAMGNACEDLKKVSNYVTDSLENDGYEKAINYIIENE